ncbi:unnamed protein product [Schistosoma mattheei]|uniref:PDZ domain-containing protein n=1 Tax=Schistosoma mattheei TaxID=31246 RepID=A0A3P8DXA5_9TREM|nr:unnamed protein product [Schistosoma mattheei]
MKNERPCLIDHVLTGSNAERSGVRAGDILLKVNGVNVISVTHEEVASLIWRCHKKLFIEVFLYYCLTCSFSFWTALTLLQNV